VSCSFQQCRASDTIGSPAFPAAKKAATHRRKRRQQRRQTERHACAWHTAVLCCSCTAKRRCFTSFSLPPAPGAAMASGQGGAPAKRSRGVNGCAASAGRPSNRRRAPTGSFGGVLVAGNAASAGTLHGSALRCSQIYMHLIEPIYRPTGSLPGDAGPTTSNPSVGISA
jgi:hypothetical protein